MKSTEIRKKFLEYFASKGHEIVASAPMVIKDDPTLMFTNAGMNQFKDVFLGNSNPDQKRVTDSQKCLRVSGKHNDLEEVGVDTYHHTMFEMLGNWSFGDYFKKEAIEWAWDLLVNELGVDKSNLYASVFGGDKADGLDVDSEALEIWKAIIPEDRILLCDKTDNFWEMGETGPCGPCSEIHVDLRSDEDKAKVPGAELVNKDHPEVIEIWNLVFMEFNRKKDKSLEPLPSKHIDTGMGFERLATVLQGKSSNYDTDVFTPLIEKISELTKQSYGRTDSKSDVAIRVISDHVRAVAFSIADGQLPSNTGAGYVIRRILRRAIRYAYSFLEMDHAFIFELVEVLDSQLGEHYSELRGQKQLIAKVIHEEEENFLRTLEKGLGRLGDIMKGTEGDTIDGKQVFELYDTFGFPVDLTALIASEKDLKIDEVGFEAELQIQKERSRSVAKIDASDWVEIYEDSIEEFVGYDQLSAKVKITRYREIKTKGDTFFHLVFNLTPFYPSGGGQVGDRGKIVSGKETIGILDTTKENNVIIHKSKNLPTDLKAIFHADVNPETRNNTELNHTGTHLLHHALREVLGTHVEQKGSLVNAKHLRFDFSHFSKMTLEEIQQVENRVNELIRDNNSLEEHRMMPIDEAKDAGAMMLFGEKYGDTVRMIQFGGSKELCGGTHVQATGDIGLFKILHESAIAAGIRRIEAISGQRALDHVNDTLGDLSAVKAMMKNPQDVEKAIQDLINTNGTLQKQLEQFNRAKAKGLKGELLGQIQEVNGVNFLAVEVDLGPNEVKDLSFQLKSEVDHLFAVFGSKNDGKALLTCVISESVVEQKKLNAGAIIQELAKEINGGGGGQAFFATAGGKSPEGIKKALKNAANFLS